MDDAFNLVARLEVQENELLEIYEPAPGYLLLSGAGAPESGRVLADQALRKEMPDEPFDVERYWRTLTDASIPESLQRAIERRNARKPPVEHAASPKLPVVKETPDHDEGLVQKHLSSAWCDDEYYTAGAPNYSAGALGNCIESYAFVWCLDHRTGSASVAHDDAKVLYANVCPYRGDVRMGIAADEGWISQGTWDVPENTYRWKHSVDGFCGTFLNDCPWIRMNLIW